MDTERTCITCNVTQALAEYYTPTKGECKTCCKIRSSRWRIKNRDKRNTILRNWDLKSRYGITINQYNELLKEQNYSCALCGKHEDAQKRRLAVDHNHLTGEIRGLLCDVCNYGIVGNRTNPEFFRKVADYVTGGIGLFVNG